MELESNGRSLTIKRLKAVKSAYILEADASMSRGLEATAMGLFVKAAELELELAECFDSRSEQLDGQISRFSAASCYFRARQYQRAAALLRGMPKEFPKAQKMLAECEGKEDVPLTVPTPGLQALIDLLVKKNLIDESEWAEGVARALAFHDCAFGGYKESGFAGRDKSIWAHEQYTELKTVWMAIC